MRVPSFTCPAKLPGPRQWRKQPHWPVLRAFTIRAPSLHAKMPAILAGGPPVLSSVDRVQLVVPDRAAAVRTWQNLFDAEPLGEDLCRFLNAHRTTVQAGTSLVEFLEPAGPGAVQVWADRWGQGLFGAGFATPSLLDMVRHLDSQDVPFTQEGDVVYVDAGQTHGMPTVISEAVPREPVGNLRCVYEVTNPVRDWQDTAAHYTRIFGLDPTRFSHIRSAEYGYEGTLTLFDPPGRLDRIEITQTSGGGAMDRFFHRRGPSLYMCFVECDDLHALADRLEKHEARFAWSEGYEDGASLFVHPSALFGMLMGVSRTHFAWTWSGRPELARTGAPAD